MSFVGDEMLPPLIVAIKFYPDLVHPIQNDGSEETIFHVCLNIPSARQTSDWRRKQLCRGARWIFGATSTARSSFVFTGHNKSLESQQPIFQNGYLVLCMTGNNIRISGNLARSSYFKYTFGNKTPQLFTSNAKQSSNILGKIFKEYSVTNKLKGVTKTFNESLPGQK